MGLQALLDQCRLMLFNISVERIVHHDLVVYFIMDLDVGRRVVFWNGGCNALQLPLLSLEVINILLILIIQFLLLRDRRRLGLWHTSLPIIRPRLIDNAHIILQTMFMTARPNSVIGLNISVSRRALIVNHRQRRFLSILIRSTVFTNRRRRARILNILANLGWHERITNRHTDIVEIMVASCTILRFFETTAPIYWFATSRNILSRGHIIKIILMSSI